METTIQTVQLTKAHIARLDAGGMVAIPASWDEFMEFLPESPYRTEYHNDHIIVMGLAAFIHELLIGRIITMLTILSKGQGYYVAGSNVGVLKTIGKKGYYNPDVTVVKGFPAFVAGSDSIITNPFLIVEVLSESTASYDLIHKMMRYKRIESVQGIVFVDRFDLSVMVVERTDQPNVWLQTDYENLSDTARIGLFELSLSEVFGDLPEEGV